MDLNEGGRVGHHPCVDKGFQGEGRGAIQEYPVKIPDSSEEVGR